ncbi:MAG: hypothetical protein II510_01095, partial [Erysipelotrichales bacterium]|nr:hypothetical protein [Erysipelotrichales bacterium]
ICDIPEQSDTAGTCFPLNGLCNMIFQQSGARIHHLQKENAGLYYPLLKTAVLKTIDEEKSDYRFFQNNKHLFTVLFQLFLI